MNLDQKIEREIRILREYEPPEGYYLAFSGGKDSQVCEHLLRMSGVKYDSHYNSTTIDAPDLMKFIRKDYPETNWHYPIYMKKPTNFYQLITRKGLPSRKFRWCCQVFKEGGGYGRLMIDGVRAAESPNRAKRQKFEYFLNKYYHAKFKDQEVPPEQLEKLLAKNRAKQIIHIIFDWSTQEVWEFIKKFELNYCKLYDEGYTRIGCVGCPMASEKQRKMEYERYPRIRANIIRAITEGKERKFKYEKFKDPEEVFDWWISGISQVKYFAAKQQITIDFINEPVAPKLFSFGHAKPHLPGEEPEIDIRYDGKSTGETFKTAKTEPK